MTDKTITLKKGEGMIILDEEGNHLATVRPDQTIEAYSGRVIIDTGTTIVVPPEGDNSEPTEYAVSGFEDPGEQILLRS